MLHTINLTKTGLQNYNLGGAPLGDVIQWVDENKTVPVWDHARDKFWYGSIIKGKEGYLLFYDTKFSTEIASREGCIPLAHDFPGSGVDFTPTSWDCAKAILVPRYVGDDLQTGERIVYSLSWGRSVKVKLGISTDGHYGMSGKYHPKSLGWVIIEEL